MRNFFQDAKRFFNILSGWEKLIRLRLSQEQSFVSGECGSWKLLI